jgi:hypothetical protein
MGSLWTADPASYIYSALHCPLGYANAVFSSAPKTTNNGAAVMEVIQHG